MPKSKKAPEIDINGKSYSMEVVAEMCAEAEGWQPEEGAEIRGTVLGVKMAYSDVSESNYPIVFVMPDDRDPEQFGAIAVHGFGRILVNELRSQRPLPGDRIFIKRGKEREATRKGWSGAINYVVLVTKPDGKPADPWDAFGGKAIQPEIPVSQQFNEEPPF